MAKAKKTKEFPESYRKVLHYFFSFPGQPISLNDLSKNLGSSKNAVRAAVLRLIDEGFLNREIVGNAWRLSVSQKHRFMATRKIPYNLGLVYESGIVDMIYKKVPEAHAIILFGSYRWGTDNEISDIDIAVEILGNKSMEIKELATIDSLGLRKNVKVNIHVFSRAKIDLNLFTNIANGILLDGLLEVHP